MHIYFKGVKWDILFDTGLGRSRKSELLFSNYRKTVGLITEQNTSGSTNFNNKII